MTKTLAITIGEASGIGPEIILKALKSSRLPKGVQIKVIGLEASREVKPGKPTKTSATIAWAALEEASQLWKQGKIDGIVTAPIHKENMTSVGFPFPGHTEYFSHLCKIPDEKTVMAFYDTSFCVGLTTAHLPLKDALRSLTPQRIQTTTQIFGGFLKKIGISQPKIGMAGINPHAGENGLLGSEEKTILLPAVKKLRKLGWKISDPLPPDTIFLQALKNKFDGVISHYHDQGLIAFKMTAFDRGVNVTLGLPLIRTSPDHGTALDIAGKNKAKPDSLITAIQLAAQLIQKQSRS